MSKFLKGFSYAFQGIVTGSRQRNFKIHLAVAAVVIAAGIFFEISTVEWIVCFILIAAVISAELFNSAIESICDICTKKLKLAYVETKDPRDLAAGGVLVVAISAVIIGLIIFLPKIIALIL